MRLTVEAEKLGLPSVWTTEHHFVDDGYMPSLMVVSGALAAATSTIEIGTGVVLAPLYHPLRLAEDAATASLLSSSRFTLGLGLGWSEIEYQALGVPMQQRGKAMEEILAILPQAWSGKPFRHDGEVYSFPEVAVRPTPSHPIQVLIGGGAEVAIRRAARLADGIFSNAPTQRFVEQVEWVRDECEQIGRDPATIRIIHYSVILPGESEEAAWDHASSHLWQMTWKYSDMEASAGRPGPPPPAPPFQEAERKQLMGRSTIAGTGEQIVESLLAIRDSAALDVEFVARSLFSTMSYDDQLSLIQQLAEEVSPHV